MTPSRPRTVPKALICDLAHSTPGTPAEALNVQFDYDFDAEGRVRQVQRDYNERTPALFQDDFRWADFMFTEMFGGIAPPVRPLPAWRS